MTCADCDQPVELGTYYVIVPPSDQDEDRSFWALCVPCWDRMIGAAMMTMLR